MPIAERMEYLIGQFERDVGAPLKAGIGRLECLLDAVGVTPAIEEGIRRTLNEMSAVRNVVVHCVGRIDKRFIKQCPWFGADEGESIVITRLTYQDYRRAVGAFAAAVIDKAYGPGLPNVLTGPGDM